MDALKDRLDRGLRAPKEIGSTIKIEATVKMIIDLGLDPGQTLCGNKLRIALADEFDELYQLHQQSGRVDVSDFEVIAAWRDGHSEQTDRYDPVVHKTMVHMGTTFDMVPVEGKGTRSYLFTDDQVLLNAAAEHMNQRLFSAAGNRTTEYPPGPFFVKQANFNSKTYVLEFQYPYEVGHFIDFDRIEKTVNAFATAWRAGQKAKQRKSAAKTPAGQSAETTPA